MREEKGTRTAMLVIFFPQLNLVMKNDDEENTNVSVFLLLSKVDENKNNEFKDSKDKVGKPSLHCVSRTQMKLQQKSRFEPYFVRDFMKIVIGVGILKTDRTGLAP